MNNFYTNSDKKTSDFKAINIINNKNNNSSRLNSYMMNRTSMISDILTTQHTTIALTDENNVTARKFNNPKFQVNPNYIKQINNISNDKVINHLLDVIVSVFKFIFFHYMNN